MPIGLKELETFKNIPDIVEQYVSRIPEEMLDKKRSESAWTIREHVFHLVGVQEMLLGRIRKIIDEEKPVIEPYFPDKERDRGKKDKFGSIKSAMAAYRKLREEQIRIIQNLDDSVLDKEANHKEYIRYTIRLMAHHMIFHEYWHMYRIEEIWLTKDEYFS